jgi:NADH-quinone oxidoreductase subunit M
MIAIYWQAGTTDIPTLLTFDFPKDMQMWLWLAFFASFAVKMPMWPVHTWLPDAHVEAPTAGSVILAGILLKMGGYGFLRFSLPMFPDASLYFAPMVFWLSVIAIIYTSLVALMQEDIKKLIAYSSVAHMGFVTLGIFTMNEQGIQGALFQMPAKALGHFLWKRGDGWLIDGFGPNGVAARVMDVTRQTLKMQTGYVYHYAFAMLIGVSAYLTWYLFMGVK